MQHEAETFGDVVRSRRAELADNDKRYSVRQLAARCEITPAYLSRIERNEVPPPAEALTKKLAGELGFDADVLLALSGKVSTDLKEVILKRPKLFADLIRQLKSAPDDAVLKLVRDITDGDW